MIETGTNDIIDIESIMEEIREDIRTKGLRAELLSFEDIPILVQEKELPEFDIDNLAINIDKLRQGSQVSVWSPIQSRPGIVGKVIVFIKRLIRKCCKFYVEPMTLDQNANNLLITENFDMIYSFILKQSDIQAQVDEIDLRIHRELVKKYKGLQDVNRILADKIKNAIEQQKSLEQSVATIKAQVDYQNRILELYKAQVDVLSSQKNQ